MKPKDLTMRFAVLALAILSVGGCSRREMDWSYSPLRNRSLPVVHSEVQSFMVDTILAGLERPYSMAFLPDRSILVTERRGHLLVVRGGEIVERIVGGNVPEELRDLALHPDYARNGWIYISYYENPTETTPARTVVMRARLDGDRLIDDEIVYAAGPFREDAEWYGSRITFDRDNHLYVAVGQRYLWDDPPARGQKPAWPAAQDLGSPSGKTMRLLDDGGIPADNPFLATPGALPEIFTLGHRQHQGLLMHPETGEIWSTEHGEFGGSELNLLKPGANYGWPLATFSLNYDSTKIADPYREGMEPPVHHWTPSIAPSGLDFVTSDLYPAWKGNVLVAALVRLKLVRAVLDGGRVVHDESLLEGIGRVRSVRVAPDGMIYVLSEEPGLLVRLVPVDG